MARFPGTLPVDRRTQLLLLGITVLGLALRLWTIEHGAPYRMGSDEPVVLQTTLRIVTTGDWNPHFFDYGGLLFLFHAIVTSLAFLWGANEGRWDSLDDVWIGNFLTSSRIATAMLGALIIPIGFRIGLRWGREVGLIAAALLAVLSPLVREAHFALTDTPLTLLIALTLVCSLRAQEDQQWRSVILAGASAGLAAAVKYNGAIVCALPAIAALSFAPGRRVSALMLAGASAIVAFLLAAPYTLLDLPTFLNQFAVVMQSYNRPHTETSAAMAYLGHLRNWLTWPGVLPLNWGYLGLMLALSGALLTVVRAAGWRALLLLTFPVLLITLTISQGGLVFGRYVLPLAPMLAVLVSIGTVSVARQLAALWPAARQFALPLVCVLAIGPTCAASVAWNMNRREPTTLDQAARWMARANLEGAIVMEGDWIYLPPPVALTRVQTLSDKSLDQYRAEGVTYIVANSNVVEGMSTTPTPEMVSRETNRRAIQALTPARVFAAGPTRSGPTVTVWHIAP